jgi:hypothetical protein
MFDKKMENGALCWLSSVGFFQLPTKKTQNQYTGEVTLNQQALAPI